MVYFTEKTALRQILGFSNLVAYAHELEHYYPGIRFVPCKPVLEGNKWKKKSIGTWKESRGRSALELEQFQEMTILSVYLGDQFVVIDQDSKKAIDFIDTNFTRGNSLVTWSNQKERCGFWFQLPPGEKIVPTQNDDLQLEIRTGAHYQAIAGVHPAYEQYTSDNNPIEFLTVEQLDQIRAIQGIPTFDGDVNEITEEESLSAPLVDIQYFLELLELYGSPAASGHYSAWLQSGMIFHWHSQGAIEGLDAWHEWSKYLGWDKEADEKERLTKWESFKSNRGQPKTIATLAAMAKSFMSRGKLSEKATPEKLEKFADADKKIKSYCGNLIQDKELAAKQEAYNNEVYDIVNAENFELTKCEEYVSRLRQNFGYQERDIKARLELEWRVRQDRESAVAALSCQGIEEPLEVFNLIPYGRDLLYALSLSETPLMSAFLMLVCGLSSLLPKGERYKVSQDFPTTAGFLGVVVGESGTNKSGLFRLLLEGLKVLDKEEALDHQKRVQEYEAAKAEYDSFKGLKDSDAREMNDEVKDGIGALTEPINPGEYMHRWITPDGSIEGIRGHNLKSNSRQYFLYVDEMGSLAKVSKGYTSHGKDDDPLGHLFIDAFNGSEIKGTFATKKNHFGRWGMSMFAGVQPRVLPNVLNLQDHKGSSARLLFTSWGLNRVKHRKGENTDNTSLMAPSAQLCLRLMRGLLDLPVIGTGEGQEPLTVPTDEAFDLWNEAQDSWMVESFEDTNLGYALWLRKLPIQAVRVAGLFHDLRRVGSNLGAYFGETAKYQLSDYATIDGISMRLAIEVCEYWRKTHKAIFYNSINVTHDSQVMSHLLERLAKFPDGVTVDKLRDTTFLDKKKMRSKEKIQPLVNVLVKHRKVIDIGNGKYRLPTAEELPGLEELQEEEQDTP